MTIETEFRVNEFETFSRKFIINKILKKENELLIIIESSLLSNTNQWLFQRSLIRVYFTNVKSHSKNKYIESFLHEWSFHME